MNLILSFVCRWRRVRWTIRTFPCYACYLITPNRQWTTSLSQIDLSRLPKLIRCQSRRFVQLVNSAILTEWIFYKYIETISQTKSIWKLEFQFHQIFAAIKLLFTLCQKNKKGIFRIFFWFPFGARGFVFRKLLLFFVEKRNLNLNFSPLPPTAVCVQVSHISTSTASMYTIWRKFRYEYDSITYLQFPIAYATQRVLHTRERASTETESNFTIYISLFASYPEWRLEGSRYKQRQVSSSSTVVNIHNLLIKIESIWKDGWDSRLHKQAQLSSLSRLCTFRRRLSDTATIAQLKQLDCIISVK